MRLLTRTIVIGILAFASTGVLCAQEMKPCQFEAHDTETEMREFGTGTARTAFEALTSAIKDAMASIRPKFMKLYPDRGFEYSLTVDKSEGNIELDTSIGQPAIVCNEIEESEGQFTSYVVISFEVGKADEWQQSDNKE